MSDTVDYGPLAGLIGRWEGDSGLDVAPEPPGDVDSPYYEWMVFSEAGDVDNADSQDLVMLHYHQRVFRKRNDEVFHNETGFISWDPQLELAMLMLAIPRGLSMVAGGTAESTGNGITFQFSAKAGDPDWSISQAPFLESSAKTIAFKRSMVLQGDSLTYAQSAEIDIYGRAVKHTDNNVLIRTKS